MKQWMEQILVEADVRSLLSQARQAIKEDGWHWTEKDTDLQIADMQTADVQKADVQIDDAKASATKADLQETFLQRLLVLLSHEDGKTRKNAALLLGDLASFWTKDFDEQIVDALWSAFEQEETKFVLSSYIKALGQYPITGYEDRLRRLQQNMQMEEVLPEEKKHHRELLEEVSRLIEQSTSNEHWKFQGITKKHAVLLTCWPYMRETLLKQVEQVGLEGKMVRRGVRVMTNSLDRLWKIRTFQDLWFVVRFKDKDGDLAQKIADSELLPLLEECYGKKEYYPFRMIVGEETSIGNDAKHYKNFLFDIEEHSHYRLRQTKNQAPVTLYVFEKKDGDYILYAKMNGCKDPRFTYRKQTLPTAMAPVIAAQVVELVAPYLRENVQVADPFCGCGSLLIERAFAKPVHDVYGIDTFGEAIFIARENTKAAQQEFYYINRDFFDFTTDYLMDEILTEYPRMEQKERSEVDAFYKNSFDKMLEITKSDAMLFLVSAEEDLIKKQLRLHKDFALVRQLPMRKKEQIFIIKRRG